MVLNHPHRASRRRTLVVPDETSWLMWGLDPVARGLNSTYDVAHAEAVLLPRHLPRALDDTAAGWLKQRPDLSVTTLPSLLSSDDVEISEAETPDPEAPHAHGDHHDTGHESDHESGHHEMDMMAIVGEPSADGLVMETVDVVVGPLASPLPGGLVLTATLDGEQVTQGTVRSVVSSSARTSDVRAPLSWRAMTQMRRDPRTPAAVLVLAVETERALNHAGWLRSLSRLLGWRTGVRQSEAMAGPLLLVRSAAVACLATGRPHAGADLGQPLAAALKAADELFHHLRRDQSVRRRLTGLAVLTSQDVQALGIRGPVARASGVADDARQASATYEALDFRAPVTATEGDAHARAAVRAEEAVQSLRLLDRVLSNRSLPSLRGVEGPRGPLEFAGGDLRRPCTVGGRAALLCAEACMEGLDWADALAAVCSFDLSPWAVDR